MPGFDKLQQETVQALTANGVLKRLGDAGIEVVANSPTEFAPVIKSELPRWAKLINRCYLFAHLDPGVLGSTARLCNTG